MAAHNRSLIDIYVNHYTFLIRRPFSAKIKIFDMKLLKKAKRVQRISKEFVYLSYFQNTSMGLLVWSDYKFFVKNGVKHNDLSFRQNEW